MRMLMAGLLVLALPCGPRAASLAAQGAARWERVRWEDGAQQRGTYLQRVPPGPVRGLVVLLGIPDEALLPDTLARAGIATIRPEVRPGALFLDRTTLDGLRGAVADAMRHLQVPRGAVVVGGVSLGGTGAIRFAQHCNMVGCGAATPAAVFAVDAPLDMERVWRATAAVIQRGAPESNLAEAQWLLGLLAETMGGPPDHAQAAFLARSPFSYFAPRGGNARFLVGTAVRLYAEPDIEYWIRERRYDYYTINAFDAAALVNQLLILGHERAELVTTSGRGFRPDGTRNPHSWTIVNEPELAGWILRQLP